MSINISCPNCFKEGPRMNFGPNRAAESKFHNQPWCNCGYSSPAEMMEDQELGFVDPRWVRIAKYFLNEYYLRLGQGRIESKSENLRFFLKLLQRSGNNYNLSIELVPRKNIEETEYVYDGKPIKQPRNNIFDNSSDLEHLPSRVILETLNINLAKAYNQSKQTISDLETKEVKYKNKIKQKNIWITGLGILLLIALVALILSLNH